MDSELCTLSESPSADVFLTIGLHATVYEVAARRYAALVDVP